MNRQIIHIDQEKCNGCGACAAACHEGAIAMVGGKATLMRDDYCDGMGDCLPHCPTGAITFEQREAAPYNEAAVQAAKGMDYAVCFEGVENEETYRYLQSYGDVLCQGYYFARPLPAEDLLRRLREEKTSDGSEEI